MVRQATNYSPMKTTVRRPNISNTRKRTLMDVDPIFDPRMVYQDIPDFLGQPSPVKRPSQQRSRPSIIIRRPPTIAPPLPVIEPEPLDFGETIYNYELEAPEPTSRFDTINPMEQEKKVRVRIKKPAVPKEKAEPVQCPRPGCDKKFVLPKSLEKHILNHDVVKEKLVYTCNQCQKMINSVYQMKIHLRIHTGEKPYVCEFCEIGFAAPRTHKKHMKQHEGQILYKPRVPIDPREKKPEGVKVEGVKSEFKTDPFKFKCTRRGCSKKFLSQAALTVHTRIHTGEKPFACTECPMRFRARNCLRNHLLTHTGEKPYQCDQCDKAYPRLDSLRVHMKSAHGFVIPSKQTKVLDPSKVSLNDDIDEEPQDSLPAEPKKCYAKKLDCPHEGCDKKFILKSVLEKHMRIHSGEKPHKCEVCNKAYTEAYSLKQHMREHTGETPYWCNKCPEKFCRSDQLRKHLKKHVGEKTINCGICGEMFETNQEKNDHVLEQHMPEKLRIARQAKLAEAAAEEAQQEAERAEAEAVEAERLAAEELRRISDTNNLSNIVGSSGPAFRWN